MRSTFLAIAGVLALCGPAAADALYLKDGRKLSGRVKQEKGGDYEITVEGQKLAFAKDDVDKWIKSPAEILAAGKAQQAYAAADRVYKEALKLSDAKEVDDKLREGFKDALKARDAYVEAAELFPEWTDSRLLEVLRLVKKYRAHMGSQLAYTPPVKAKEAPKPEPEPEPKPVPKPATPEPEPEPVSPLQEAFAVLTDAGRRAVEADRKAARNAFRRAWTEGASDVAAAAYLFLSRTDGEWGVDKNEEASAALEAFFKAAGQGLTGDGAAGASTALAEKARGVGGDAGEALMILVSGVTSELVASNGGKPTPAVEASFQAAGFVKAETAALWGTDEQLALEDYRSWAGSGDFDLGYLEFRSEHRRRTDFAVGYARALLALLKALKRNDNYGTAASEFVLLSRKARGADRLHTAELAKSIRAKSPCRVCAGTHKVNCSACKGKKKVTLQCGGCGGSGKINSLRGVVKCRHCKGVGIYRNRDCPKCKKTGKTPCKARDCAGEVPKPTFETFAEAVRCSTCRGKGRLMRHVSLSCPECRGIGLILHPVSDPSKTLD